MGGPETKTEAPSLDALLSRLAVLYDAVEQVRREIKDRPVTVFRVGENPANAAHYARVAKLQLRVATAQDEAIKRFCQEALEIERLLRPHPDLVTEQVSDPKLLDKEKKLVAEYGRALEAAKGGSLDENEAAKSHPFLVRFGGAIPTAI